MVLAHVGNGKVFLKRAGTVHLLSREHTRAQELVRRGLLSPEEAPLSDARLEVTRALGRDRGVQVDTILFDVLPGDSFLLCNSCLYESSGDVRIDRAFERAAGSETEQAIRSVVEAASVSGNGNPTALLLVARDEGPAAGAEELRRRAEVSLKIDILKSMYLFEELTLEQLLKVIEIVSVYDAKSGESVVREGDIGEHLFVILEGSTEVLVGNRKVGELHSGNHFGEIAILVDRPRIATVRAVRDSRLLVIPRSKFLALVRGDQEIGVKLMYRLAQELAARLTQTTELIG
jgi:PPM family protein phosphatase